MLSFSNKNRSLFLAKFKKQEFDVLIIGGGITGAGVFLDGQSRGLKTCLLEMQDFAEGTSSKSTRLVHGGLRYLKQFNFKLVMHTGRERTIINKIARHLTYPKKVLVPTVTEGTFSKFQLKLALWIYEKLANVPSKYKHIAYTAQQVLEQLPIIKKQGLQGAIAYTEFQTNDARLTLENIKKGVALGGIALNKIKVTGLLKNSEGKVVGVKVKDVETNLDFTVNATVVVSAAGAWTDTILKDNSNQVLKQITPSKGVHLVFNKAKFPITQAIYFDTPDKRMMFAIPEDEMVYVGTTDTFYTGNLLDIEITKEDVSYILKACNTMFTGVYLQKTDIISGWAGVRPLIYEEGKSPSEISRKEEVFTDTLGLIGIAGGKLTGYRVMAKTVIDLAVSQFFKHKKLKECHTQNLLLCGSNFKDEATFEIARTNFVLAAKQVGWTEQNALWVFKHFGSESSAILQLEVIQITNLPNYLVKSLLFTLQNEMVRDASDFFIRRTNLLYFHPQIVRDNYLQASDFIAQYLEQSAEQKTTGIQKIEKELGNINGMV